MNRRIFLLSLLGLPGAALFPALRLHAQTRQNDNDMDNPYAGVDWDKCQFVHSMSHQHGGQTDAAAQSFYEMGYRHLMFSNYYPSAPTYPLAEKFLAQHPDVIASPNSEQHSFLDSSLHCNPLGSLLATGYGQSLKAAQLAASPLIARFDGLTVFNAEDRPGNGVYRLDIVTRESAPGGKPATPPTLTIEGAVECALETGFPIKGEVRARPTSAHIYLRATAPTLTATLDYDKTQQQVTQFRLMQGNNRPWREVFRDALDKLQYADGGGITLNHPTENLEHYLPMLDFDPRVLGIEVWNQLTTGFGSTRGFYDKTADPHLHFYQLWDDILRSGRRCWGFFVKDHQTAGRGRNILLLPDLAHLSGAEREQAALRAYRNGAFFGSVAALAAKDNKVVAPFDQSAFRFSHITLRRDGKGRPAAIEVAVAGNDTVQRPNLQIRFVTEKGIEQISDGQQAELKLGEISARKFVRVEAFAYPATHLNGTPLTREAFSALNVEQISSLHDQRATSGPQFFGNDQEFPARIPIVDMIFSQPLRFLQ